MEKRYYYHFDTYAKIKSVLQESPFDKYEKVENTNPTKHLIPLFKEVLDKKGNWSEADKSMLKSEYFNIDFAFTNLKYLNAKTKTIYRIINDPNFFQDKSLFHKFFEFNKFIVKSYPFLNSDNFPIEKNLIIKPDLGQACSGIVSFKKYDKDEINQHIKDFPQYESWAISEIFMPKIVNEYVVSNRIYLLFISGNGIHKGYYYNQFLNYIPNQKYTGNILDPNQFYTNYLGECKELDFLKKRFIPHKDYIKSLDKDCLTGKVFSNLENYFREIFEQLSNNCYSTNENFDGGNNLSFHIYGADILINNSGEVKILEINSAPQLYDRYGQYKNKERFDYIDFIEKVFEKTINCENKYQANSNDYKFVKVFEREFKKNESLFYIPKSVYTKYPFIKKALENRGMKKTSNPYDRDIKLFYGLREPYIYDDSAVFYYDEILNYLISYNMRKSRRVNKIQGITRYLASKDELYKRLILTFGEDCNSYMPETFYVHYGSYFEVKKYVKKMLKKFSKVDNWIVKPVYGSRGISIKVFDKDQIQDIIDYICNESEREIEIVVDKNIFKKKYNYWVVSKYVENPHLFSITTNHVDKTHFFSNNSFFKFKSIDNDAKNIRPSLVNKKYNLRFYVVLAMNKLPTYSEIKSFSDNGDNILNCYVFKEYLLYFSLLAYNEKKLVYPFDQVKDKHFIESMRTTTNLENINRLKNIIGENKFDFKKMKDDHTCMFNDIYPKGSRFDERIREQILDITKNTVDCVKYDLRPINRFYENYESCFNILAYDTLVDNKGNLWLIEINRGPDMFALVSNYGSEGCQKMFEQIFNMTDIENKSGEIDTSLFDKIPISYKLEDLY